MVLISEDDVQNEGFFDAAVSSSKCNAIEGCSDRRRIS